MGGGGVGVDGGEVTFCYKWNVRGYRFANLLEQKLKSKCQEDQN